MKLTIITSMLFIFCISCTETKPDEITEEKYFVTTNPSIVFMDTLTALFSTYDHPFYFSHENSICRYYDDTLNIESSTGFGYEGGHLNIKIVDSMILIHVVNWGCVHRDTFVPINYKTTLNKQKWDMKDTILVNIDGIFIDEDTFNKCTDTLLLKGDIKVVVREKDYTYQKKWQEIRMNEFFNLAAGRPDTIEYLWLYDLDLDTLPNEIMLFTNLKKLNLDGNSIEPKQFKKLLVLKKLEELNISHNTLTELPPEILKMKKLKVLEIFANKISELPNKFSGLTNLIELQMESNEFTVFPDVLRDMTHIKRLYMAGNKIHNYEKDIASMPHIKSSN